MVDNCLFAHHTAKKKLSIANINKVILLASNNREKYKQTAKQLHAGKKVARMLRNLYVHL